MYQKEKRISEHSDNESHSPSCIPMVHRKLWDILSNRQTYGLAFRQNEVIGKYLVDFCCHSEKIIVEISDFPFENAEEIDNTMERHLHLMEMGYTILGFDAKTILTRQQYIRDMIKTHVQINHTGNMDSFNFDFGFDHS